MINRVVLVGRTTKDIEIKKTESGLSICNFTLACERRGKDDGTDFIQCVAWRQQADFLSQYAKKGNIVAVDGRIQTRNYDDRDGKRVYVTEIVADNVRILSKNEKQTIDDIQFDEDLLGGKLPY